MNELKQTAYWNRASLILLDFCSSAKSTHHPPFDIIFPKNLE
jgi:hypothetical protein